ncbi:MAG: hypothetical protein PF517_01940 [Salinivirgaceae bacterium]|nr:hypothetical protein [Salinivirgaceae bacterium]
MTGILKICVIGFFVFLPTTLFAQKACFVVIDSSTMLPVPYCNIQPKHAEGFVSNHQGEFCISPAKNDSTIGFELTNIAYYGVTIEQNVKSIDSIIFLNPKPYELNEIEIDWSKYKFYSRGNYLKRVDTYISLWRFCQIGIYVAPLKKGNGILEHVSVFIQNKNANKTPFRLHVYKVDSAKQVGEELLPVNVFGKVENDRAWVELDILNYQIEIPEAGVFVAIELLSNNRPEELQIGSGSHYFEKHNNKIGVTKARYKHRKLLKLSSWKPGSYYIEKYPFTNVEAMVGDLPMIQVKVRQIKD